MLEASGILVHLNNLESLSEADATVAARIIRDLRDPVLLAQGFHFVLVGSDEAVRTVVASTRQVRDVFSLPRPLRPLDLPEIQEMLQHRYVHLRMDTRKPPRQPVEDAAVADLHALFGGNVRGLLLALEDAARTLIEDGVAAGEPMSQAQVRFVLRSRYQEAMEARLDPGDIRHLQQIAEAGRSEGFTQADLEGIWGLSRSAVSRALKRLEGADAVVVRDAAEASGPGRRERIYALSPVARLALEPLSEGPSLLS